MYKTLLVGLITFLNISPVLADNLRNEPIKPIKPFIITEPAKVELGKTFLTPDSPARVSYPVIPAITSVWVEVITCQLPLVIIGSKAQSTLPPYSIPV